MVFIVNVYLSYQPHFGTIVAMVFKNDVSEPFLFFLKLAHFDEIERFQFLTNFTKITLVSHRAKL